jgi:hypothetical protein
MITVAGIEVENCGGVFVIVTARGYEFRSVPSDNSTVTVYDPTSSSPGLILIILGFVKVINVGPPLFNKI